MWRATKSSHLDLAPGANEGSNFEGLLRSHLTALEYVIFSSLRVRSYFEQPRGLKLGRKLPFSTNYQVIPAASRSSSVEGNLGPELEQPNGGKRIGFRK
jgi:hypothetical protein